VTYPGWADDDEPFDHDQAPQFSGDAGTVFDRAVERRTAEALRDDPQFRGRRLEVAVQNRVVILRGEVDTCASRDCAARVAWTVHGVFDVCNQLTVAGHEESWKRDWPR
jgi:osmotically-inducible protein OsmY